MLSGSGSILRVVFWSGKQGNKIEKSKETIQKIILSAV